MYESIQKKNYFDSGFYILYILISGFRARCDNNHKLKSMPFFNSVGLEMCWYFVLFIQAMTPKIDRKYP